MRTAWECSTRTPRPTRRLRRWTSAITISTDRKFHGAATVSNGKVIFAPYNADGVGVFDPSAPPEEAFVRWWTSHRPSLVTGKFRGAATAGNGKVIFAPFNADGVGVFDPNAPPEEAFTLVDISDDHHY